MAERGALQRLIDRSIADQRPICLDSSAIIEYGNEGAIATLVDPILEDISIPLVYSMISIAEVLVRPARARDIAAMNAISSAFISRPNAAVVPFDEQQALEAAWVRAETRMKLPDCAIISAARTSDAIGIVGVDRVWSSRPLGVPFFYLPDYLGSEER